MTNLYIESIISESLKKIQSDISYQINIEKPKNPENGDISTNIAFQLSKQLKKSPIEIAKTIVENLKYDELLITDVNIANPGFINFKLTSKFYQNQLSEIAKLGLEYGKSDIGKDKKINVEYVSANPTGLLHLGHGRNAVIGDTISNLHKWCGYDVTREYYFNNAGNQMNNLGKSVHTRYLQQVVDADIPMPEDAYNGEYVKTIASKLADQYSDKLIDPSEENYKICRKYAEE